MKYIRPYKSYIKSSTKQTDEELVDNILDISVDITDSYRFKVHVNLSKPRLHRDSKGIIIYLSNHLDYDGFLYDEVSDVIERLIDFLGERFIGCTYLPQGEIIRRDIMYVESDERISSICIDFK